MVVNRDFFIGMLLVVFFLISFFDLSFFGDNNCVNMVLCFLGGGRSGCFHLRLFFSPAAASVFVACSFLSAFMYHGILLMYVSK